ncbi:arginyl-tRNA synthetase [Protaetiibacter larvae]|uniref:Arginyl-tRNA synthetase n=1 Tax=Protaetiibacter larvae TaxID=2592654 RepID=A0A5C1YAW7_9MICO|nr:arginyl-tRNA synthetase [Protaetiibacter larvae]QEO10385.1 arginyl-tRNA synthetase [Protaetiibacter larvae]
MPRRSPALVLSASVVLGIAVLLSGCRAPEPAPSSSAPAPGDTPSASPEASPSATPTPSATPVDVACDALIPAQAMYDFNPNFSLIDGWSPDAGSAAADAVAAEGVACRWQNNTSSDVIDLSVAQLDSASLEAKANEAYASSTMVPTYGDEAYFAVAGGVGEAIVFAGAYWVVIRSPYFQEPGDASPLVEAVLAALP